MIGYNLGEHKEIKSLKNGRKEVITYHLFSNCNEWDIGYKNSAFYKKIEVFGKNSKLINSKIEDYKIPEKTQKEMNKAIKNCLKAEKEHFEKTGERIDFL